MQLVMRKQVKQLCSILQESLKCSSTGQSSLRRSVVKVSKGGVLRSSICSGFRGFDPI